MLYIVRVIKDNVAYEYGYGNMNHALDQYNHAKNAEIIRCDKENEKVLRWKINGKEQAV